MKVSNIGLGCWPLGGMQYVSGQAITYGDVSETKAIQIVKRSIELGINTFDTADSYSLGASEIRLGKALSNKRKSVNIFTKAGFIPSAHSILEVDISYHHLIASLRGSLKRLNTDYVDLFQAHQIPRTEQDIKNIEKTFSEIKATGEARFCGVSIGREIKVGSELISRGIVDSLQMYFSLLDFEPSLKLFNQAYESGIGIIAAVPLAQGFLSGKFIQGKRFDKFDIRNRLTKDEIKKRIHRAKQFEFLIKKGRTLSQAALAYITSFKQISVCIPGAKNIKQLQENIDSSKIMLTSEELKQIKEIQQNWN